jgi:membrane protease YdiL (CAAX protease family)
VPLVFGVSLAAELVYRRLNYTHPPEHDLLRALGRAGSPVVAALLVLGATVAAPLSEELLFRGHLQTLLRRAFAWLSGTTYPYLGLKDPAEGVITTAQSHEPPARWATWAGIGVTALLFTVVHIPWTWPPIFVLAVCLGYAYERTGNLWVPITMHAVFNAASTVVYVLVGPGQG